MVSAALGAPVTLGDELRCLQQRCGDLIQEVVGQETGWRREQAVSDLSGLRENLSRAQELFSQDSDAGPTVSEVLDGLSLSCQHLEADRVVLEFRASALEELLARARAWQDRLRAMRMRFEGRALPRGVEWGLVDLSGSRELPEFHSPQELLRGARLVTGWVEALGLPNQQWREGLGLGVNWWGPEMRDLRKATYEFEAECSATYERVQSTVASYHRLEDRYLRARGSWMYLDALGWSRLDRAMARLSAFYKALEVVPRSP